MGRIGHWSRDVRLLFYAARFTGQIASNLLFAALFVVIASGDAAAMGLTSLLVATLIPSILFGLAGGALADRTGAARGLILGASLRIGIIATALIVAGASGPALAIAFAWSVVSQLCSPAELALVHSIERRHPGRVHSWLVVSQYAGQGVGVLAFAPVLYFTGGPTAMLGGALAAAAVVFAMYVLLWVRLGPIALRGAPARQAFSFGDTVRFFLDEPRARYAIVVMALKNTVTRGIVVTLPIYLAQDLDLSKGFLPAVLFPGVVGAIVGLWWCARTVTVERAPEVMRLSIVAMVTGVLALAVADYGIEAVVHLSGMSPIARLEASMNTTFVVAVPAAFVLGLAFAGSLISSRVTLTGTAPANQQARIFAVQGTITESLLVLPLLLTGVGTEVAGARATLAAIGIVAVFAGLLLELPRFRRPERIPGFEPEPLPAVMPIPIED